ncbi:DNA-processing protein DprA [candidate division WWE3 bacterium]|uniref:DNA-processing protein DprA n=1 Tax=candidate division WWE3 bacterium TaxID=2053526 RepID=A0A955LK83_UNCKA|nr:DNA-processing protein DprA [candidate division WWE3 bacterium]
MQQSSTQLSQLVRIHLAVGLGDRSVHKLFLKSDDLDDLIREIERNTFFGLLKNDKVKLPSARDVENVVGEIKRLGVRVIPSFSSDYPVLLRDLYDPPPIIYFRGDYKNSDMNSLGVVGTRRYTRYGEQVVQNIVGEASANGITIISGMAIGIDTFAHKSALANNARTIAVLGSGVDVIAPAQNARLYQDIIEHGCVISEFPMGTQAARFTFPQRNRIIAALSRGVLVVEAGEMSGTLITADFALDIGREVYAVPGSIFSHASVGTNKLLSMGAKPVLGAETLLNDFDVKAKEVTDPDSSVFSETQLCVFSKLSKEPKFIDDIIVSSGIESNAVVQALLELELKGFIKRVHGDYYFRG